MASPTVRDVHIDTALSAFSVAYRNQQYVGEQVFPRVPVAKQSDFYWQFTKQSWQRIDVAKRAPGTRSAEGDYEITSASYYAPTWAISKVISDEMRANADEPLRPDVDSVEWVMDQLLRAQEKRIADLTTGGSALWAYSATPSTAWTSDTSDPLGDIENAINGVVSSIGRMPNVAVMSWDVWRHLRQHPDMLDWIKYTRPGARLSPQDLNDRFGFEKLLIGMSLYDPALEGQTGSPQYIWGDGLWMGYVPSTPALLTPAAGYVLEWNNRQVRRFRRDEEYSDKIEASHAVVEVITASDAGACLYDVV